MTASSICAAAARGATVPALQCIRTCDYCSGKRILAAKADREQFIADAKARDLKLPDHLTEALRTNRRAPGQRLIRAASRSISFVSATAPAPDQYRQTQ
jgi:hypothetical protein